MTQLRRKTRALLAYLAVAARPCPRHACARLFCQEAADPAHTLRLMLSRLRRVLGADILQTDGDTVFLDTANLVIDTHQFQQITTRLSGHEDLHELVALLALYHGEFLAGLHLPDAPEFELWLLGQRSYWQQLHERSGLSLLPQLVAQGQYETAVPVAQKLLRHNALLEEAHYWLIWLYTQMGQRDTAVRQFEQCQILLRRELAVEPTPVLQTLYADVRAGRLGPPRQKQQLDVSLAEPAATAADFVGREAELARMQAVWAEVVAGHGRVVLVTAPAGGGKTRFVTEWAQTLPNSLFLHSVCYESTRTLAYHPWLKILAQLRQRLDTAVIKTLPAPWLDALSRLLPDLTDPAPTGSTGEQIELFTAVYTLLKLAPQPLLLFVDDWQWADAASLQLLHFLVERELLALLVGAYRTEEAEDNPDLLMLLRDWARRQDVVTIMLAPLPATAVTELINRLWPQLPAGYREPHLRDWLLQATGGNPLFVNEIVRELAGSTHLPEELPVPPSLRDLIQRRLRQLPASGRQVLESLAILDQPTRFELAQQVSGRSEDETLAALELGLRWRLLVALAEEKAQIEFNHDLMAQAVRELLSPIRKQLLHRRAAIMLSHQGTKAAILAYHWHNAGDTEQERMCATRAGHEAAALYAYQEAINYWQRALVLTADPLAQAALYHQIGRVWVVIGDWDKAEAAYQAGLVLVGAEVSMVRAEIQAAYGLLLEYKGVYAAALVHEEAALAYFQSVNDHPQIARTLGLIALLHWRQARYEEALQTCQQALADPEALTDTTTHIRLLNISGLIYWRQQAIDAALDYLQRAHELALRHHNRQYEAIVLSNLGNVVQEIGQYDQAIAYYEQALALNEMMQNKMGIAMNGGNLGLMYFYKGDDDTAVAYGQQALQMDRELGNQESVARHLNNLANSFSRLEQYEEAFDYCQQALLIDAELGNRRGALIHAGNLSSIYLLWGRAAEALACLAYALHLDDRLEHTRELARHLIDMGAIFLFENQIDQAEKVCQWGMEMQQKLALDFELCWAWLVQGRLLLAQERWVTAVTCLQQAVQTAQLAHRSDIHFEAEVLLPRAQWLAGQLDQKTAVAQLQNLLAKQVTLRQQAAILYEQWQLDKSRHLQAQAQAAYEQLLKQAFIAEARQRALELGVSNPPMITIPALPDPIANIPLDLDSLLQKVEHILATG